MELSIPVPVPELPNVIPAHPWPVSVCLRLVGVFVFVCVFASVLLSCAGGLCIYLCVFARVCVRTQGSA